MVTIKEHVIKLLDEYECIESKKASDSADQIISLILDSIKLEKKGENDRLLKIMPEKYWLNFGYDQACDKLEEIKKELLN
jgi:hypothetical protein